MKKTFLSLFAVTIAATANSFAGTVYWNANTTTPTTFSNSSDFTGGTGVFNRINTTSGNLLMNSSSASTTSNYASASGGNNFTSTALGNALNLATSAAFTFDLSLATASAKIMVSGLSLGSRSTGTGPQLLSIYVSSNSDFSGSTLLGTSLLGNNSAYALITPTLSGFTSASNAVYFRIYGSNGTASANTGAANWRVDDITLTYTVVPEPATYGLIGFFMLGIAVFGYRSRRARAAGQS